MPRASKTEKLDQALRRCLSAALWLYLCVCVCVSLSALARLEVRVHGAVLGCAQKRVDGVVTTQVSARMLCFQ